MKGVQSSEDTGPYELFKHIDGLYGYAFSLARNRCDAEDLVQETYVRALAAMARLRPDADLRAWMFTILRNAWFNQVKRARRTVYVEDAESIGAGEGTNTRSLHDPHFLFAQKAECEEVRCAIRQLPPLHREIILLREYQELSYLQIAGILQCPIGTVMSRLGRARSKLGVIINGLRSAPVCRKRAKVA